MVRSLAFSLPCDELCEAQKSQKEKLQAEEARRKRTMEEEEARIEAERFQKKIDGTGRRKNRGRGQHDVTESQNQFTILNIVVGTIGAVFIAILYLQWS